MVFYLPIAIRICRRMSIADAVVFLRGLFPAILYLQPTIA